MQRKFDRRLIEALGGVSGVHVTPFDASGAVWHDPLARVVDDIASAGIDNIVTGGNTGEFYALTLDEIGAIYRTAAAATGRRRVVTAGIGRSFADACRLADAAAEAGADMVMLHQAPDPFQSPGGVIAYTHRIADASALPVVLYLRNDPFSRQAFGDLIAHPKVIGVKYASPDIARLTDRIEVAAEHGVLMICGLAETWAPPFQAAGANEFTSGLVNVLPSLSLAVRDALHAEDFATARAKVRSIAPFEAMRAMQENGCNVTVVKESLRLLGIEVGDVRPPGTVALSADEVRALARILRGWDLPVKTARAA